MWTAGVSATNVVGSHRMTRTETIFHVYASRSDKLGDVRILL